MKESKTLWIARNKDGKLYLHRFKPILIDGSYTWEVAMPMRLNPYDYPEVTFENSPMQVELKLKEGNG